MDTASLPISPITKRNQLYLEVKDTATVASALPVLWSELGRVCQAVSDLET